MSEANIYFQTKDTGISFAEKGLLIGDICFSIDEPIKVNIEDIIIIPKDFINGKGRFYYKIKDSKFEEVKILRKNKFKDE